MIHISPKQNVFNVVRRLAVGIVGEDNTWTYNPPEGTEYPFIRIGEIFSQSRRLHKQDLNGDMQVTIHIWHDNARQRGTLIGLMTQMEDALIDEFNVNNEEINTQIIEDNTTAVTLLHGVVEVNIRNYK